MGNQRPLYARLLPLLIVGGLVYPLVAYPGRQEYVVFLFRNPKLVVITLIGWGVVLHWLLRQTWALLFRRGTGEKLKIASADLVVPKR